MISNRDVRFTVSSVTELAEAYEEARDNLKALRSLAEDVIAAHDAEDPDEMQRAIDTLRRNLP